MFSKLQKILLNKNSNSSNYLRSILFTIFILITGFQYVYSQTTVNLTSSGNFTIPCGVSSISVTVWGGGGGGAGDGNNGASTGGGGGSGGMVTSLISVTPGQIIPYTIGLGGAGGCGGGGGCPAAGGSGGSGGNSTFLTLTALGGNGGQANNGSGGAIVTGGNPGQSGANNVSGAGGAGFGAGGNSVNSDGNGNSALANSAGGGSGANHTVSGTNTGGNGGSGRIIITYTATIPPASNAGADQTLAACATTTTLNAVAATPGTGTWSCVSGCAGVTIASPTSATSAVSGLTPGTNTVLRWTVTNAGCTTTTDDVTINTLVGPLCPSYCSNGVAANPYISGAAGAITNVTVASINNNSTWIAPGYLNATSSCAVINAGNSYPISVSTNATQASPGIITTWADWNGDGDFADAGESQTLSTTITSTNRNASGTLVVPAGAVCGATIRFRVMWSYTNVLPTAAEALCGRDNGISYGETEDYCFTISCAPPSCTDGIQNGDETGIDCGGATCPPCTGSCDDGIQNGDETGIDCGGSCPLTCTTNTTSTTSTTGCTGAELATVYSVTCDQLGTSAFNTHSPNVQFASGTATAPPAGTPSGCGTVTTTGTWVHLELEDDVEVVTIVSSLSGISIGSGNSTTWVGAYNTNSTCPTAGSYVGCTQLIQFSSGMYFVYNASFSGLDGTQDLWLYIWNDNNKDFTINTEIAGSEAPTTNVACPGESIASTGTEGCNLGATGASWPAPETVPGVDCAGGAWTSNENTVYYSFTATETTGSLEIDNIACNAGTSGAAQFAVWQSCANVGTYGAGSGFMGCAVGTAPLSLSPLTPGQTYYLAIDGTANSMCEWNFSGTGIVLLPVKYTNYFATHHGEYVDVNWTTGSERNNDYFTVQRTLDGVNFEDVGTVKGVGNSSKENEYNFIDKNPYSGTSYYRIKQTDFDGRFEYSNLIAVKDNSSIEFELYPNPTNDNITLEFKLNSKVEYTIVMYDYMGSLVYMNSFDDEVGNVSKELDLKDLTSGIYLVEFKIGSKSFFKKFVKM